MNAAETFAWLRQVQRDARISPAAFELAFVISQYANSETGKAWPTQQTLASVLRSDTRTVRRLSGLLHIAGHLHVEVQRRRHDPNVYRLLLDRTELSSLGPLRPDSSARPPHAETGHFEHLDRTNFAFRPDTDVLQNYPQELTSVSSRVSPAAKSAGRPSRRRSQSAWPAGFILDDEMLAVAKDRGFSPAQARAMFDKFHAHAEANDRRCANWRAAWRQWVLHERSASGAPIKPAGPIPATFALSKPAARA